MTKKPLRRLDKPFRSNLRALWREFKRCSEMYRPLYHDQLRMWTAEEYGPLLYDSWLLFSDANMPNEEANEWWIWEQMPVDFGIGRYSGCSEGLQEFKKIAESAAILFHEMEIDIGNINHRGWLALLHEVAFAQQLPLLRCRFHPWGRSEFAFLELSIKEYDDLENEWHCTPDGVRDYPIHPPTFSLIHSVFTSSMTLIEAVLNPDSVIDTSYTVIPNEIEQLLMMPSADIRDEKVVGTSPELAINFPPDRNVFKKVSGKGWFIQFAAGGIKPERGFVDGSEGFHLIQKLLSSEKQPVSYLDLYGAIPNKGVGLLDAAERLNVPGESETQERSRGRRSKSGTGVLDIADQEAIKNYRDRRKQLLTNIEQSHDIMGEKEREDAEKELGFINKQLSSATNVFGKSRQFAVGTPESVARNRVKTLLCDARALLKHFPNLSEFLELHLKPQGAQGRQYTKAGEVKWET